jgi:hypothetical protein
VTKYHAPIHRLAHPAHSDDRVGAHRDRRRGATDTRLADRAEPLSGRRCVFIHEANISYSGPTIDALTLPYPPEDVRCVLLQHPNNDAAEVLFVSYFNDNLWHEGWVIFADPHNLDSPKLAETLRAIGCALNGRG